MIHAQTIARLSQGLRGREYSAVEVARAFLDRVDRFNGRLGAFITVEPEKTLAHAREADARIARGEAGPLTGVPIAHKDLFCARGFPASCRRTTRT